MDTTFYPHLGHRGSQHHSSTNLQYTSLSPITSRLPIDDIDSLPEPLNIPTPKPKPLVNHLHNHHHNHHRHTTSQDTSSPPFPRSKSSSHLVALRATNTNLQAHQNVPHREAKTGTTTPTSAAHRRHHFGLTPLATSTPGDTSALHSDSGWLVRAGALLSAEAREYKGQTWLTSRASSTSLAPDQRRPSDAELLSAANTPGFSPHHALYTDGNDCDAEDLTTRLAQASPVERRRRAVASANASRHPSAYATPTAMRSRRHSRSESRVSMTSWAGPQQQQQQQQRLHSYQATPLAAQDALEDYFGSLAAVEPDFVDPDDRLEALGQKDMSTSRPRSSVQDDEAVIRRLVKQNSGKWNDSWFGQVLGWTLFSGREKEHDGLAGGRARFAMGDDDDDEEEDDDDDDDDGRSPSTYAPSLSTTPSDDSPPHGHPASPFQRDGVTITNLVTRRLEGVDWHGERDLAQQLPPVPEEDNAGWGQDVAWLMSVASKVFF